MQAANTVATSAVSSAASALTTPAAPSAVTAVAATDTVVTVAWTAASTTKTGFKVERSADAGGSWTTVATPASTETSFEDAGLDEATAYTYRVSVQNGSGYGPTTSANVTTKLTSPTGLTATAAGATSVSLAWTNASSIATGVRVERRAPAGVWGTLVNLSGAASYTDSTVAEGTSYEYRVVATASGVPASLPTGAASVSTPAKAVTGLAATVLGTTSVKLDWTDVSAVETGFRVERRPGGSGGAYSTVTTLSANASTYTDTGLTEGTSYEYRVVSLKSALELASGSVTAQTTPAAPSGLTAASPAAGTIRLSWTDNSAQETGFLIQRSADGTNFTNLATPSADATQYDDTVAAGSTYTYRLYAVQNGNSAAAGPVVGLSRPAAPTGLAATVTAYNSVDVSWSSVAGATSYVLERSTDGTNYTTVTSGSATSATDAGRAESTTYSYRVRAVNASGVSVDAAPVTAVTPPQPATALDAAGVSPTRVDLTWAANSLSATSYTVYRSTAAGAFVAIDDSLPGNAASFSDTTVVGGTAYAYKVVANDGALDSAASNTDTVTTVPAAVAGLNAVSSEPTSVALTWNSSTGANAYRVERSVNGTDWDEVDTISGNSLTDEGVTEGTAYTYRVTPAGVAGDGPVATTAVTTLAAPATSVAVSDFTDTTVTLTWVDNSGGETGFVVERSTDGENFTTLTTTAANAQTYTDSTAAEGTQYVYRVSPTNAGGTTPGGTVTIVTRPTPASNVVATGMSATSVQVTWDDNSNIETGYNVYRRYNGVWTQVADGLAAGTTIYMDDDAAPGTEYDYTVTATGPGAGSALASLANVTTVPAAVADLSATMVSTTRVDLTWTDVSGNTGYRVERKAGSGSFVSLPDSIGADATSFSDTTASEGTAYEYRVVAVNAGGDGEASNTASATTPPAAPTSLAASPTAATTVHLTWADNSAGETSVTVQRLTDDGWVTAASLSAGATSTDVTVDAGSTNSFRVFMTNAGGDSGFTATEVATTVPGQVTGFTATVGGDTAVALAWSAVPGATGYRAYVSDDNGSTFSQVGSDLDDQTLSVNATGLTAATAYQFKVLAFNGTGAGADSTTLSRVTLPAAPTGFQVDFVSTSGVSVSWNDVSGETGYTVYRQTGSGAFESIADLAAGTDFYLDENTAPATSYTYKVVATNGTGASADSGTDTALTLTAAPAAPTLTAATDGSIQIAWAAVTGATNGYKLYRDAGSGFSLVGPVAAGTLTYTDTDVGEAHAYSYKLTAVNATGESDQSDVLAVNTAPAAPTGAASMSVTTTGVTVTWTDASAGEDGFVVEQSTDGGDNWTTAGTPAALSNTGSGGSFAVSGLTEATDYDFRVVAVLNGVRSAPSGTVSVTTLPSAPTGLTVTASTDSSVSLSWIGHSAGATNFVVQRSTDGTTFSDFDTPGAGTTTSADTGLTEDTQYYYRVAATRGSAVSAFATAAPVTTALAAPTGLSATVNGPTSVTVNWTDHSSAESAYVIERSVDGGNWQHLDTIAADLQTYTDSAAPESAAVAYRVRAESIANASEWATATGVATPLSAPTGLTLTASADAIDLAWTDTSGVETGYRVQRSPDGTTWSDLSDLSAGTQQFSDTGLAEDTTYHYRVVALDGTDPTSDPSNAPTAKTLLAAPTSVAVSGKTATSVTFGWTNHSAAAEHVVLEEYDAGNDEWDVMATLDPSDVTYTLTGLDEGTAYQFRLSATKTGNTSAAVGVSATTLPAAPTGLTVDASAGSHVDLAWTDAAGSETAYKVERSTNGGAFEVIDTLSTGANSYSDTDVAEAHTYAYRVYAVGAGGNSAAATGAAVTAPSDPSGFSATPMSPASVNLAWTDNSAGETAYVVERSPDGSSWGDAVTLDAGTDEYLVTGLTEGTTYHFRVKAVRADDAGTAASAWVATSTSTPAAAPTDFAVSVPTGAPRVDLTWQDNSAAETGYRIERMTNEDDNWTLVTTTAADATSYSDTGLAEGTRYDYRVMAASGAGNSNWAPSLAARTRPLAPTSLVATATSDTAVGLAWTDNSAVETGYRVQRSPDGTTWSDVTDLPADTQQFADTGLAENTTYHYRVLALDGTDAPSDPSNAPNVLTPLAAPTSVAVTGKTATTVTLGWANQSAAATNVVVEQYDAGNDEWDALATLAGSATTYTATGLTEGTAYQFRVTATKSGNASAPVAAGTTTLPATPTGLSVAAFSTTRVDLAWTDAAAGETGYKVERSTNGGAYEVVGTLAADADSYQDSTAEEGHTYAYLVYAFGGGGDSATAGGSAVTAPADPSSLTATPVSPTRVDLAWADNSGGETAYVVQRSLDGTTWTTLPSLNPNSTTYSDTTRTEGTAYQYRVRAERSTAASGWVSTSVSTPAAAPTSVGTSVPSGSPRVVVSWADNSAAESGYQIDRSTDGTTWTTVTTTAANATSYSDGTVTEGMTYQYRVRANSSAGNSAWSSPASASTRPSAPTGLAGSAASGTSVNLTWTDVSANEAGYKVEQSVSGVWTVIATLSANAATHTVTGLTEGTSYQFRVRAYTAGASGDPTSSVTVATPLGAPSGLSVTPVSTSRIDLAWTDNSAVESNFKVERSTDNTVWTTVATLVANTASYSDTTVAAGTTYYYRVKATKSGLSSTYATASAVTTAPTAPTNAVATANSDTQVTLTWTDAAGETGYTVERSGNGGSTWAVLTSGVAANATTYTDSTTTEETAYLYRVKATNSAGSSGYATAASVTTLPTAPSGLTAEALSSDTAELHWTNASAAASGVKIERRVSGGGWSQIAQVAGNVTSYVDPTLDESVEYEYRVRATSGGRNSAYSNTAGISSLPLAATSLAVTGTTTTTVTLGWSAASAAPTAVIERSDDGGDTFTAVGTVAGNVTTFTDDDVSDRLVEGTTYQYRVRMYNGAGGFSDPTDTVVAVTLAAAPTGVQANVSAGNVLITWADQSNGEEGFRVERRNQGDSSWTFLWDVEPGTGQYEDVGPDAGSYQYRVSAYNAGGTNPSDVVSAVVPV
ncbi:MAG TPA: fibronectin type III domain-containing protein [Humisphaera sp.]